MLKVLTTVPPDSSQTPTVVVSRPGIMQQSLRSSLTTCCGISVIGSSGEGLTALHQVRNLRPALLVIDANLLDEEVTTLLAAVKTEQPAIRCLVFVRSIRRRAPLLALGADAVALRDAAPQELQTVLARLAAASASD